MRKEEPVSKRASATSPSPLTDLPAEIRNLIYRLVVFEDVVRVTATGLVEPGLLSTSKTVRDEAGPIFYSENAFELVIIDYDPTVPRNWSRKFRNVRNEADVRARVGSLVGLDRPHWDTFCAWLRDCHSGETTTNLRVNEAGDIYDHVLSIMFSVVRAMSDKPWCVVEALLMEHRAALVLLDGGWAA